MKSGGCPVGEEARLGARLDLDGGGFHKSLKEARMEVKSFQKDLKFIEQGMGLAFGVMMLQKFGAALQELRQYQADNGIEIVSTHTLDRLGVVEDKLEEAKMTAIAYGAAVAGFLTDAVEGMSTIAGALSGGKDVKGALVALDEANANRVLLTTKKELIKVTQELHQADLEAKEAGKSPGEILDSRKKELADLESKMELLREEVQLQAELHKMPAQKIAEARIKMGEDQIEVDKQIKKVGEAQKLVDADHAKKLREEKELEREGKTFWGKQRKIERLEEDVKGGIETPKQKLERLFEDAATKHQENLEHKKKEGFISQDDQIEEAELKLKVKEEATRQQKEEKKLAEEIKVQKAERGYELQDATSHIGFQHQSGGAYDGLVGNLQNKDLSIAERNAKASEKLVQLAEHWARRDAVDKIKHGDGL